MTDKIKAELYLWTVNYKRKKKYMQKIIKYDHTKLWASCKVLQNLNYTIEKTKGLENSQILVENTFKSTYFKINLKVVMNDW